MFEQDLITDLAIAERNVKGKIRNFSITYGNELRNAFSLLNVNTYIDLVQADQHRAMQLRSLAIQEKLI